MIRRQGREWRAPAHPRAIYAADNIFSAAAAPAAPAAPAPRSAGSHASNDAVTAVMVPNTGRERGS